jgi:hypothetical protein
MAPYKCINLLKLEMVKINSFPTYDDVTVRLQITTKQISNTCLARYTFLNFFLFFQGLKHDSNDKLHLGSFTYDINGSPRQTFEVMQEVICSA